MNQMVRTERPFLPHDRNAIFDRAMLSLVRACVFRARQARDKHLSNPWKNDEDMELVLRGVSNPATTANSSALVTVAVALVAALRPVSAAAQVLAASLRLSFDGAAQISVPSLTVPAAQWIGEAGPIPVSQGLTSVPAPKVDPYKLASLIVLSHEMVNGSNAEPIVKQALLESVAGSLEVAFFGTGAGVAGVSPPGIMNSVAPIAASALTGIDAMCEDIGKIARALAPSAGASPPILVAAPEQAASLAIRANRDLWPVYASNALPAGTIVGVVPAGLATVVDAPKIEASAETALHMNDPASADIGGATSLVGSIYQTDQLALRLILDATWTRRSNSTVAWVQNTKW